MIYILAAEGTRLVKIGCSVNITFRIAELRHWSPLPLSLLWVSGPEHHVRTEKQLHRLFETQRVHGEWFDFGEDQDVVALVRAGIEQLPLERTDVPGYTREAQRRARAVRVAQQEDEVRRAAGAKSLRRIFSGEGKGERVKVSETPSALDGYMLVPVRPGGLEAVFTILDDAAGWLVERGIDQWPDSFQPDDWRAEALRRHAAAGEVYLLHERHGAPVGTMTVTGWADLDFAHGWPDGEPGNARYVARLAVLRRCAGRGIGGHMLDQAVRIAQQAGVSWLRLDCAKTNLGLHRYYERHGFAHVNTVDLPFRRSGALFQRAVPRSEPQC